MIFDQQQSLACQKTFSNTFNNLVGDNTKSGLLGNNNIIDINIDIDSKVKSNLDDNITCKNNNDFCKDDSIINIENLFK